MNELLYNFLFLFKKIISSYKLFLNISEYKLILEGYYYCEKRKCICVIIRPRGRRAIFDLSIQEAISDKNLIKELHPLYAYYLGLISSQEKNSLINSINCIGVENINRFFSPPHPHEKSPPKLLICEKVIKNEDIPEFILQLSGSTKRISIKLNELVEKFFIISCLDPMEALSIGYDLTEFKARLELK